MFNKEPAILFGGLGEIAKAVIPVLVIGGFVAWDEKMVAAIMFLVGVSVTSLTAISTRQSSVAKVVADKQIEIAKASSIDTPNADIIKEAKETA